MSAITTFCYPSRLRMHTSAVCAGQAHAPRVGTLQWAGTCSLKTCPFHGRSRPQECDSGISCRQIQGSWCCSGSAHSQVMKEGFSLPHAGCSGSLCTHRCLFSIEWPVSRPISMRRWCLLNPRAKRIKLYVRCVCRNIIAC